jgi:two-component system, cell cycle response regulator
VTDSKTLKLLLVEDDLEDEQLLCEALIEIEENRQWCTWRTSSIVHVEQLADVLDCLRRDRFDAVLLNLSLPDSPALLDTFLEAKACARGVPIVVLADEDDENLANRLLREGAQDIVLKSELECASLARSLRYAIERQCRTSALRSSPFVDDLTGALTRQGFVTIAEHYTQLSRHSREALLLASIDIVAVPEATQDDRDARELVLIRAAEVLRGVFEAPCLLGRVDRCRFGLIAVGLTETTVEALLNRVAADIEDGGASGGRPPATVRFSVAELDSDTGPDELLGQDGDEFAARTHRRMKTVMLAD